MKKLYSKLKHLFTPINILSISIIITITTLIGCENKSDSKNVNNTKVGQLNTKAKEFNGTIDLQAIDANKDGKLFECPMDINVLSDVSGSCPKCKMDLVENPIEQVKENLEANDFQVK